MMMRTMQVATTLPVELIEKLDKRLARTMKKRAEWLRDAILKQAAVDGMLRVSYDDAGDIYELGLNGAAA